MRAVCVPIRRPTKGETLKTRFPGLLFFFLRWGRACLLAACRSRNQEGRGNQRGQNLPKRKQQTIFFFTRGGGNPHQSFPKRPPGRPPTWPLNQESYQTAIKYLLCSHLGGGLVHARRRCAERSRTRARRSSAPASQRRLEVAEGPSPRCPISKPVGEHRVIRMGGTSFEFVVRGLNHSDSRSSSACPMAVDLFVVDLCRRERCRAGHDRFAYPLEAEDLGSRKSLRGRGPPDSGSPAGRRRPSWAFRKVRRGRLGWRDAPRNAGL